MDNNPMDNNPRDHNPRDHKSGVPIPPGALSPEALRGVIEEFVTRDGTELTDAQTKIEEVTALLERGEVEIWYDEESRTCNIVPATSS